MTDSSGNESFNEVQIKPFAESVGRPCIPQFDAEEFREYVEGLDATEEQKIEYLHTLWQIALTFVDIAFGVNSSRHAVPMLAEFSFQNPENSLEKNVHEDIASSTAAEAAETEIES